MLFVETLVLVRDASFTNASLANSIFDQLTNGDDIALAAAQTIASATGTFAFSASVPTGGGQWAACGAAFKANF